MAQLFYSKGPLITEQDWVGPRCLGSSENVLPCLCDGSAAVHSAILGNVYTLLYNGSRPGI